MAKCKHTALEVITLYKNDKPAKIELVICPDCNVAFPEIQKMMQNREDEGFKLYGNKSPVVIWNPEVKWVEQRSMVDRREVEEKLSH